MKAAGFDYLRARSLDQAIDALKRDGAKAAAGFQSLGPMLNLRLAQPSLLVDISNIPELRAVEETSDGVVYGACVTHSEIEDQAVPDVTGGALPRVAAGIAYRAVRNRGSIGGSLAHADPAADWPTALAAVGARVRIAGPGGVRSLAVEEFCRGAFDPALEPDEIVVAVEVPRFSPMARWGFWKFSRKVGEYAEAMCAVLIDPEREICRLAIGATESRPVVIADGCESITDGAAVAGHLARAGLDRDPVHARLHRAAIRRALAQANQPAGIAA